MYKRILVPLDGSELAEQVLPYARLVAKALQAQVELLRVFESVPEQWADPTHGRYIDQLTSSYRNQAVDYLDSVASPLRQDGLAVNCSAHEGNPAEMIIGQASRVPDTLAAMSTHGEGLVLPAG